MDKKINGIQIFGLVVAAIGLLFILFPEIIGTSAIMILAFLTMAIGGIGVVTAIMGKRTFSIVINLIIFILGWFVFFNPGSVLFFIGIALTLSGLSGIVNFLTREDKTTGSLVSPLLITLMGIYAMVTKTAALATVLFILGIILMVIGVIIVVQGKKFNKLKGNAFTNYYHYTSNSRGQGGQQGGAGTFSDVSHDEDTYKEDDVVDVEYEEIDEDK